MANDNRDDLSSVGNQRLVRLLRLSERLAMPAQVASRLQRAIVRRPELTEQSQLDPAPKRVVNQKGRDDGIITDAEVSRRLRAYVESDASWSDMEPIAWRYLEGDPSSVRAGKLIELSFIHGSPRECMALVEKVEVRVPGSFAQVYFKLRAQIVSHFWADQKHEVLFELLRNLTVEQRLPVEHLYWFYRLLRLKDRSQTFLYFQQYRDLMRGAVEEFGEQVNFAQDRYAYLSGKLALELGFDHLGRELLQQIPPDSSCYGAAVELIMARKESSGKEDGQGLINQIMNTNDWGERVEGLRVAMLHTRTLGGFRDRQLPAINEILRDPMAWVPATAEAWRSISELIVAFADLEAYLPNLFRMYQENALKFVSPQLDQSLWEGPLYGLTERQPEQRFWRGVALFHRYINTGPDAEESLWQARQLLELAEQSSQRPLPFDWRELHRAGIHAVSKAPHLFERDRDRMLLQLRVAANQALLAASDIRTYLNQSACLNYRVLSALQHLTRKLGERELEYMVLAKRSSLFPLTNADLACMWSLACGDQDSDLAWRVATILKSRTALDASAVAAWKISGEHRSEYAFVPMKAEDVRLCTSGFSTEEVRLVEVVVTLGPLIPELLALLDPESTTEKRSAPPADSLEFQVETQLNQCRWLPSVRKHFRTLQDGGMDHSFAALPFAEVIPSSFWVSLFNIFVLRLGIPAWRWRASYLAQQIEDLVPRLAARADVSRYSMRVGKWLRSLNGEQRTAWQDLLTIVRKVPDERVQDCLAIFSVRAVTAMYPDHHLALSSLRTMRVPLPIIWGLESFLISPEYSAWRRQNKLRTAAPVPRAMREQALATSK